MSWCFCSGDDDIVFGLHSECSKVTVLMVVSLLFCFVGGCALPNKTARLLQRVFLSAKERFCMGEKGQAVAGTRELVRSLPALVGL